MFTIAPQPLVVRVFDTFNNQVGGASVEWTISGGGSGSTGTTTTDATGRTSATRTVSGTTGEYYTTATLTTGARYTFVTVAAAPPGARSDVRKLTARPALPDSAGEPPRRLSRLRGGVRMSVEPRPESTRVGASCVWVSRVQVGGVGVHVPVHQLPAAGFRRKMQLPGDVIHRMQSVAAAWKVFRSIPTV